jgi:phage tail sheath protein FI
VADSRTSGADGVELAEQGAATRAIARVSTATAAFVGRTLKGPVNQALLIGSFAEFQHHFGGLWQPSTLSYAIEQFFENGGSKAYVVRVMNGARPPTITLRSPAGPLVLIGVNPGSREYLRASVDYDGIAENEPDRFNLVVQRVRSAGSELIQDQEILRRISVAPQSGQWVPDELADSRLVRVLGAPPDRRPERSAGALAGNAVGYALSNPDGDDGAPITDYDVIGSAIDRTGLFALPTGFNFLCIPPLAREHDVGSSTLLVAAKFCRERHAMLIVDPPMSWVSPRTALDSLRSWPFRSDSAVMYFPRVQAFDRLRGRVETFASCGAAAGMIARCDETWPVWAAAETDDAVLRPGLRPAVPVSDAERLRLMQSGINVLGSVRSSYRGGLSPRTLAAGGRGTSDWKYLSARRLALFVASSIEQGTRWVSLEPNTEATWEKARALVETFLEELAQGGAFSGATAEESYFVICDKRVNRPATIAEGKLNLLFGFATSKPGEFDTWLVTQQAAGSRARPVSVNRLATSRERVGWEIETSILKRLSD